MKPKVSFLWINYNSASFIDLVLESLEAVKNIDYPNYELIIVDNGSNDNSLKIIKDFINRIQINCKVIELDRNLGFTGGNNVAYSMRDVHSKYVALLNSDAIPLEKSLNRLVDSMEKDETLGAVQGVILEYNGRSIHTAGNFLSETFGIPALLGGKHPDSLKKDIYITAADGAYSLYRVQAITKTTERVDRLFDNFVFACYDDFNLGLKLWNHGFKIKALPAIVARHARGASFKRKRLLLTYLFIRNRIVLNEVSNSRYKTLTRALVIKEMVANSFLSLVRVGRKNDHRNYSRIINRAVIDGMKIARSRKRLREKIDIYKAPSIKVNAASALLALAVSFRYADFCVERQMEHIENLVNSVRNDDE
jgi:GT2 family glycosyltransferase